MMRELVISHIRQHGPMRIDQYMALVLTHPEHGYYTNKELVFGADGDFITAPDISQLFGDMIAFWCLYMYRDVLGMPDKCYLVECGGGRGTLMSDILRHIQKDARGADAIQPCLVEVSDKLKSYQAQVAEDHGFEASFYDTIDMLPHDAPLIMIGNEFLDALPFRQIQYDGNRNQWLERFVGYDSTSDALSFVHQDAPWFTVKGLAPQPKHGDVFEYAPMREEFIRQVAERLSKQKGASLFIDYGYLEAQYGDSFQALYKHEYCSVLDHIGAADLTNHVCFKPLIDEALKIDGSIMPSFSTQGDFLRALGVELWAEKLIQKSPNLKNKLQSDLKRLCGTQSGGMGDLFKVISLTAAA